jgi:hypothetical protein
VPAISGPSSFPLWSGFAPPHPTVRNCPLSTRAWPKTPLLATPYTAAAVCAATAANLLRQLGECLDGVALAGVLALRTRPDERGRSSHLTTAKEVDDQDDQKDDDERADTDVHGLTVSPSGQHVQHLGRARTHRAGHRQQAGPAGSSESS